MSIFSNQAPIIRETKAAYEYVDAGGKTVKTEIGVRYKSRSVKDLKGLEKKERWLSDTLLETVTHLIEAGGDEIEATAEILETMDLKNLKSINKAINEDLDPK